ncbi:D-alanyl-D-alanine carboxypeptidase family protein [Neobacillus mesonae]|uniref:D-alanyl-D-alanine carboxypeptidase family protein n=1 Tax=Neobacillus mesonae TaxID=1193713 RepID=UPI00203AA024|nr:D-alanyl-D-alanine carboxypeptidase family protein [Neobacillus mesonae]MCM3568874.1 D-alanyl-D-alanine carboxypeptidase [Neobacillus mesonae]
MRRLISIFFLILLVFPLQTRTFAKAELELTLKSDAAILLDSETNAVLFSKNPDKKMYPASVTKIATAIYAIEKGNLNSIATVSANAERQDGTRVYLVAGEKVSLLQLIRGMLINSGNDAAVAVAEQVDGSVEQFSKNINEYLKTTVGVKNTHFVNPSGLFDKNHYTTARDMALITDYAIKNPIFAEIFGTKKFHWKSKSWDTNILSHHKMLLGEIPYAGITGGKTGYTTESKQTLSTTAGNGKIKLTAVVLKSDLQRDKYDDTGKLFDFGFKSFHNSTIKQGEIFKKGTKEFYPENDTLVTESVQGAVRDLSDNGLLTFKNNQGEILQTVQLKTLEPKPAPAPAPKKDADTKENEQPGYERNIIFGLFIFAFAFIVIGTAKKITKKY